MRRIAVVGALVGVAAMVSGCWAFGPLTGREVEASPPVRVVFQTARPNASPWAAQSIVMLQLRDPLGADVTSGSDRGHCPGDRRTGWRRSALQPTSRRSPMPDCASSWPTRSDAEAVQRVATAIGDLRVRACPWHVRRCHRGRRAVAGWDARAAACSAAHRSPRPSWARTSWASRPSISSWMPRQPSHSTTGPRTTWGSASRCCSTDWSISAPTINAAEFNGRAQISGDFDLPATQELLAILQGGVLPVAAEVLSVCPTTAEDCASPSATPTGLGGG